MKKFFVIGLLITTNYSHTMNFSTAMTATLATTLSGYALAENIHVNTMYNHNEEHRNIPHEITNFLSASLVTGSAALALTHIAYGNVDEAIQYALASAIIATNRRMSANAFIRSTKYTNPDTSSRHNLIEEKIS